MNSAKKDTESIRPTILEKCLVLPHLPLILTTAMFAAFVGPLGNFLFLYSVSGDPVGALRAAFMSLNAGEPGLSMSVQSNWYSLAGNLMWYAFLSYVTFITRYLRLRLVKAEPELLPLAPNGKEDVRKAFRLFSKTGPQLAIMCVFLMVYATGIPGLIGKSQLNVLSTPIYILRSLFRSLMFGSVLWLFCASLGGLYLFGKQGLRLKSHEEDRMLGTRKLGSLSFSFSSAYFLGLALFAGQMSLAGMAGQTAAVNVIAMIVLVPSGIALFIAPLVSTHNRMVEAKKAEICSITRRLSELISCVIESREKDDKDVMRLLALEHAERKAVSIKTWPIENPLVGKLALIAGSVAASLIARLIQIPLHI